MTTPSAEDIAAFEALVWNLLDAEAKLQHASSRQDNMRACVTQRDSAFKVVLDAYARRPHGSVPEALRIIGRLIAAHDAPRRGPDEVAEDSDAWEEARAFAAAPQPPAPADGQDMTTEQEVAQMGWLDRYIEKLQWSPDTPIAVRGLVIGNLRGLFGAMLRSSEVRGWFDYSNKPSDRYAEGWADAVMACRVSVRQRHDAWPGPMNVDEINCDLRALTPPTASPASIEAQDDFAISAQDVLNAAHDFWKEARKAGHQGAVRWLTDSSGAMVIFTRGEYRDQLMRNITEMPGSGEHHFASPASET